MYTVREVLQATNDELEGILYFYLTRRRRENLPEDELDLYDDATELFKHPQENEADLIFTALHVLAVQGQLEEEEENIINDLRFQRLLYRPRGELPKGQSLGQVVLREYENVLDEAEEKLPRDSLRVILPLLSDGETLLALADTAQWIEQLINDPSLLETLKENVLKDEKNIRLTSEYDVTQPLNSAEDFNQWYTTNFLSKECVEQNEGTICADTALFNNQFAYLYENRLIPSENALRSFKARASEILSDEDQETLALYLAWLISGPVPLKIRMLAIQLPNVVFSVFSSRYRYATDFLTTLIENVSNAARVRKQLINSTVRMLLKANSDTDALRVHLVSLVEAFGEDEVFDVLLEGFYALSETEYPRVQALVTLREFLTPGHWIPIRRALVQRGNALRVQISDATKKRVKTPEDRRLMNSLSSVLATLDYLKEK